MYKQTHINTKQHYNICVIQVWTNDTGRDILAILAATYDFDTTGMTMVYRGVKFEHWRTISSQEGASGGLFRVEPSGLYGGAPGKRPRNEDDEVKFASIIRKPIAMAKETEHVCLI